MCRLFSRLQAKTILVTMCESVTGCWLALRMLERHPARVHALHAEQPTCTLLVLFKYISTMAGNYSQHSIFILLTCLLLEATLRLHFTWVIQSEAPHCHGRRCMTYHTCKHHLHPMRGTGWS